MYIMGIGHNILPLHCAYSFTNDDLVVNFNIVKV